jgi:hypothetical protein
MKYSKTEVGQQAFKERSPLISARQRSAFIMFDGEKTVEKVLGATHGLGVTQADVDHLVAQGFLMPAKSAASSPAKEVEVDIDLDIDFAEPTADSAHPGKASRQSRYAAAKPIATQLTASLGLRGFRLNLAVEAASGYEELLKLLPKIQEAVGPNACSELEQVLKG